MADKERSIEEITFFGGQNTDVALELVPKGDFLHALNIVNNSSGEGNKGIVKSIKGNKQIPFVLPEGENKCIGTASDEEAKKFYFFIKNSEKKHGIYQYNAATKEVIPVLLNITDTGGVDILNFGPLILHADVVKNNLLYWVDGFNNARKINIDKMLDKSEDGYGSLVEQSFIDLYKETARLAPTAEYSSDTSKPFNRHYGKITKYAQRFVYHDGEKSSYSDFSAAVLPDKEPFNGVNAIPTANNCINVKVNTGNKEVKRIEIIMQSTTSEVNNEGIIPWVLIATLDKDKLDLPDNADYIYPFYNDGNYSVVDQKEVIQPYSFMLKRPLCQTVTKRSLVQSNGYEGFPTVDIDASTSVAYSKLFISEGTEDTYNAPYISHTTSNPDYVGDDETATRYDGTFFLVRPGPYRFSTHTIVIGNDVKKGNDFKITLSNGYSRDQFYISYQANLGDNAVSVANNLKQKLIATGRIFKKTPESPEANIYENIIDANGNVTFKFILQASRDKDYIGATVSVNPVLYATLKDTGESIRNIKMGSTTRYGITYEDFDGRKSSAYTSDSLVVNIKSVNEAKSIQLSKVSLEIRHRAPIWAKYYQIVRTDDLRYSDFIQLLVQKAIDVPTTDRTNYVDLVISSFFTYKKIHPNSSLGYQFEKGDRISLIKRTSNNTYYPFFETEVIAYNETVTDRVSSNVTTNGTTSIKVTKSSASNIGKTIVIEDSSREIVSVPDGETYVLNNVIGETTAKTYLFYDIIDTRGTLRIKKPPVGVVIEDNSIIEVYKPSRASRSNNTFYEFQKKFIINNPGTLNAFHSSDVQNQNLFQPAIVEITEGTSYVRNREMPINNTLPGTAVIITSVEDPSFSDFYPSLINDNGRVSAEDTGLGEVHFGSRMRFSNNLIEDSSVNGFNNFENLNREDYNDNYGDIKLTKFDTNRIYTFKDLKTAFVPVDAMITQDSAGTGLLVGTGKLLNPIQYYAWEGGIGSNPESFCSNGTHKYFVSANSGVITRLGGNGEEPLSKTYSLDHKVRSLLAEASLKGYNIFAGFNRKLGLLTLSIEGPTELESETLVFNEDVDKFGGNHSYKPEFYCKFIDSFFSFKNGQLWDHDVNPIHNNFYGKQYTSQLKFVANSEYQKNKMYFVMKIDSNGRWSVPSMVTPKNETWPNGMKSRLHENNFDLEDGKYWADIMRDMNDPEFNNELQALFEGRTLTGPMLICDLETKETKEVKLNSVFIYSSDQDRNF